MFWKFEEKTPSTPLSILAKNPPTRFIPPSPFIFFEQNFQSALLIYFEQKSHPPSFVHPKRSYFFWAKFKPTRYFTKTVLFWAKIPPNPFTPGSTVTLMNQA